MHQLQIRIARVQGTRSSALQIRTKGEYFPYVFHTLIISFASHLPQAELRHHAVSQKLLFMAHVGSQLFDIRISETASDFSLCITLLVTASINLRLFK